MEDLLQYGVKRHIHRNYFNFGREIGDAVAGTELAQRHLLPRPLPPNEPVALLHRAAVPHGSPSSLTLRSYIEVVAAARRAMRLLSRSA